MDVFLFTEQGLRLIACVDGHADHLRTFCDEKALFCIQTVAQLRLCHRGKDSHTGILY